jgi:AraC-like DNA-binding protein
VADTVVLCRGAPQVKLEFLPPAPALARHVSVYFRIRVERQHIADIDRADVGYVRFFLKGTGQTRYKSGITDTIHPASFFGPATEIANYTISGGLDCVGVVLLPDFWRGIVDVDANECANRCLPATDFFGPDIQLLYDKMSELDAFEDMKAVVDNFLLRRVKPIPAEQIAFIDKIGEWLSCMPIPKPEALHEAMHITERQVTRLANRYYGAPPNTLARKFRALRTASRLIGTSGPIPAELVAEYSDRAHLSREIKLFTGVTPTQLQNNQNPIVSITLHPDNFRADAPWT